ncbi:MAG: hypothetical protein IJN05_06240 [Ruminococcus sp.]|nr:hypothetical protein [Ruminococcus sp.]MBQ7008799.1 hypothetical protein [Ruminococcus sp.]
MYYEISEASYERVQKAIEDINICCVTEDDYNEWEDIASSSIAAFIDDLNDEQLEMTCDAFVEYIEDTVKSDRNMALGVKTALERALNEMLDNAGVISEDDEQERILWKNAIKNSLLILKKAEVGE